MSLTTKPLFFSNEFAISCGTVSVDVQRAKVLLIRCRKTGEYMLPKGRKDLGEALEQTARRETYEETGIRVELLPVSIETLATKPAAMKETDVPSKTATEPIAMSQRMMQGTLKIIFWYVAVADSTSTRDEGTQQENEEFDTTWTDVDKVVSTLSFDNDKRIAEAAIAAALRG